MVGDNLALPDLAHRVLLEIIATISFRQFSLGTNYMPDRKAILAAMTLDAAPTVQAFQIHPSFEPELDRAA